ncbi:MAG: hypothetical protein ACKV0T_21055 [Planctomycetales bacterium]
MGILIAAAVTSVLSLALVGGVLFYRSPRSTWWVLALAILVQLPMCAAAYYGVRVPLQEGVQKLVGEGDLFGFLTTFSAPLTEEPAKLWPLLIPLFRRFATNENRVRLAMALGLGFGLGEIWFLAHVIFTKDPQSAGLPWYQLGGFLNERFMVCLMHGVFTATALYVGGWRGFVGACVLHYLVNFPIYLGKIDAGGLGKETYQVLLSLWVAIYFIGMLALLAFMSAGNWQVGKMIFGEATCPDCQTVYPRPLLGLNLGPKRYERCPHCRKWHLL